MSRLHRLHLCSSPRSPAVDPCSLSGKYDPIQDMKNLLDVNVALMGSVNHVSCDRQTGAEVNVRQQR